MIEYNPSFPQKEVKFPANFSNGQVGGAGTFDYEKLKNKPQIEGHELVGNKTAEELGLAKRTDIPTVPTQLSQLEDDAEHRTVTDEEKTGWNNKAGAEDIQTALNAFYSSLCKEKVLSINGDISTLKNAQAKSLTGKITLSVPFLQRGEGDPSLQNERVINTWTRNQSKGSNIYLIHKGKNVGLIRSKSGGGALTGFDVYPIFVSGAGFNTSGGIHIVKNVSKGVLYFVRVKKNTTYMTKASARSIALCDVSPYEVDDVTDITVFAVQKNGNLFNSGDNRYVVLSANYDITISKDMCIFENSTEAYEFTEAIDDTVTIKPSGDYDLCSGDIEFENGTVTIKNAYLYVWLNERIVFDRWLWNWDGSGYAGAELPITPVSPHSKIAYSNKLKGMTGYDPSADDCFYTEGNIIYVKTTSLIPSGTTIEEANTALHNAKIRFAFPISESISGIADKGLSLVDGYNSITTNVPDGVIQADIPYTEDFRQFIFEMMDKEEEET